MRIRTVGLTFSSWNRFILVALVLGQAARSAEIKCPAYQGKHPLANVAVFDGPPEEKADLVPDSSNSSGGRTASSWNVDYIFQAGRKLYVVCRYSGLDEAKSLTIKAETKVQQCIFRTAKKPQPAELTCK